MSQRNWLEPANFIIAILGLGVAIAGFTFKDVWKPVLFGKNERFSCELRPDTVKGGEVWTVMYRKKNEDRPWLKMVTTLGGNWTPQERCQEIAKKLEGYREDGLTKLSYRDDPATPKQYVICAHTKVSGDDNCPLLVTLKPGADPYATMKEMTAALAGGDGVYQNKNGENVESLSPDSPEVNLQGLLAEEDRK